MNATANRTHLKIFRQAEYFDKRELEIQTGQGYEAFGEVVLKELIDNALDACESAGINPVIRIGYANTDDRLRLAVGDNGNGISESVIKSILNFDTRTSDKAAYKSPTRGAQGNAFKTIIGIPHALGGGGIVIESQGLRHEIIATATPAGTVDIQHETSVIDDAIGTTVYVDMPYCKCSPRWYALATALFNPHAIVKISSFDDIAFSMVNADEENAENYDSYNRLGECQKIMPNDPTNIHCYNTGEYNKLTYLLGTQNDMPLGQLVRQFDGLTSTSKAKRITGKIPYKMVSDIYQDPIAIESMRLAMQSECRPIQPKALGAVGEANLLARLNLNRHWYKQVSGMVDNVPYLFEILIGESEGFTGFYHGVNHSPTFGDFLRQTTIKSGEVEGVGIAGALALITNSREHIVIAHLIGIGLPFMERGKSNLKKELPAEMIDNIAGAVWWVARTLHKEDKKRDKDAAKAEKDEAARERAGENKTYINAAVFLVLEKAIQAATDLGRLPANVRNLFYKVRDFIQEHTTKELNYTYFSQDILIKYWQEHGRNKLIYNDPRGVLYEPHSEKEVQLGTFSVDSYRFPAHQFNKILYVEKKGLWHTIKAAGLHQKYDMAVIGGEGYASEAIRLLLEKAQVGQDYTIFVLHDADPDGYNIARTIQESTKRMPDHNIEVIDLGLNIQDAIDLGIPAETFTRKKALVKDLELNEIEQEYFTGRLKFGKKTSYICQRVELNAMSAGQLVDYIDAGIDRAISTRSLAKKVIPDTEVQLEKAAELFESGLHAEIDALIAERLNIDALKAKLLKAHIGAFDNQAFEVDAYLTDNELDTWSKPIQHAVNDKLEEFSGAIEYAVTEWLKAS